MSFGTSLQRADSNFLMLRVKFDGCKQGAESPEIAHILRVVHDKIEGEELVS